MKTADLYFMISFDNGETWQPFSIREVHASHILIFPVGDDARYNRLEFTDTAHAMYEAKENAEVLLDGKPVLMKRRPGVLRKDERFVLSPDCGMSWRHGHVWMAYDNCSLVLLETSPADPTGLFLEEEEIAKFRRGDIATGINNWRIVWIKKD